MDDKKRCSKYKIDFFLKSNFYEDITKLNGYRTDRKICTNQYLYENRERKNLRERKRKATDAIYHLIRNTSCRVHHALNGRIKTSSTKKILRIDFESYKKWIEFRMTPEMNWSNIEIDQVKPLCMFDVSKNEQLKGAFS